VVWLVHDWGYLGIVVLMAMESTIFPVPSGSDSARRVLGGSGRFTLWGVVLAGTVGGRWAA
jgi:membrane protein YqaA with SNARE-associated domain